MRHRPAHGAAVADRLVADVTERLPQKRNIYLLLGLGHPHPRAHLDPVAVAPDAAQLRRAHDVDQHPWRRDPKVHHRDQALPAGEHRRVISVLGQRHHRLLTRLGRDVFERARLHSRSRSSVSVPAQTCSAAASL
jgi:hypothetical protein